MAKTTTRDRLREPEARILALRIAATYPNREALTSEIKDAVPKYITFTAEDLKPSSTRTTECMWQQIVGNVVSHKPRSTSIFTKGYAVRIEDGIKVTDSGMAYLKSLGF
jgi:hypothetical protein